MMSALIIGTIAIGCIAVLVLIWAWEPRIYVYLYQMLAYRIRDDEMFLTDGEVLFPQKPLVDGNTALFRQEAMRLLGTPSRIPKAHEVDAHNGEISFAAGPGWRTLYLKAYGGWFEGNCHACHETHALFRGMDNVIAVMFSVMEPGNEIPPHRGKLRGFLRYQLPLVVPQSGDCVISVGGETRRYQEGQGILFDDNNEHSVVNHSTENRVVLFLDVRKPANAVVTILDKLFMKLVVLSPRFKRTRVELRQRQTPAVADLAAQ